jgi:hypothetical protein
MPDISSTRSRSAAVRHDNALTEGWRPFRRRSLLVLLAVTSVCMLYALHYADRGWIPHDDGALGQSAQRVLAGELPHRDYDELYTGGLTYLHAAAFTVLGESARTMRVVMLLFVGLWIPAVFYIAHKLASETVAAAVTLTAVVWSVPNYFAGVPSWYNLFLATFGVVALLRYLTTGNRWWVFAAGVLGGLSFLIKLSGLYYSIGVALFLVFHAQLLGQPRDQPSSDAKSDAAFAVAIAAVLSTLLVVALASGSSPAVLVHFAFPILVLVLLLVTWERRRADFATHERLAALARLLIPFGIGLFVPVLVFLVPYALSGSVPDLVRGLFVLPTRRLESAALAPRHLAFSAVSAILPTWLLGAAYFKHHLSSRERILTLVLLATLLVTAPVHVIAYRLVWYSTALMIPITVALGAVMLNRTPPFGKRLREQIVALLLCVAAFHSLIQYPYAAPIYFMYVAPLGILAILGLVTLRRGVTTFGPVAALAFYLLFGALWVNTGYVWYMSMWYHRDTQTSLLDVKRGGLRVTAKAKRDYEALVDYVQRASTSRFIYATPDCPEIYFLTGLRNPTRTLFDFFDEADGRTDAVLRSLRAHDVNVVVLNQAPHFSGPVPDDLLAALARAFPHYTEIGQFLVLTRG